ncbi:hypothetical protein Aperf_G00000008844 [Anoplocephala perfoliata]
MISELDQNVLRDLYAWVDSIPLSRPKKNISRDFSDGVLVAEVVKHFFPKYVDLHNFQSCSKIEGKRNNWQLLNWKVFPRFYFKLTDDVIESLTNAQSGTIEKLLLLLRSKFQDSETADGVNENSYLPYLSSQNSPPNIVTPTSNLQRIRRLPSIRNENSNMGRNLPLLAGKNSVVQNSNSKLNLIPKSTNKSSWGQAKFPNGYQDSVAEDLQQLYEQKVQECLELQETVDILNAKLRRMQHLLQLKDLRINELQSRLQFFQQ